MGKLCNRCRRENDNPDEDYCESCNNYINEVEDMGDLSRSFIYSSDSSLLDWNRSLPREIAKLVKEAPDPLWDAEDNEGVTNYYD